MTDIDFMKLAIEEARRGINQGQTPFGACIACNDEVIAAAHNEVWADTDATAHAEIITIRAACAKLGTIDLSGCTIYSTCEPCPMCFAACHWAKISRIVFGASISDAQAAGFNELSISNDEMKRLSDSKMEITAGILKDEAVSLFAEWADRGKSFTY